MKHEKDFVPQDGLGLLASYATPLTSVITFLIAAIAYPAWARSQKDHE
jgi:hypothetical protein